MTDIHNLESHRQRIITRKILIHELAPAVALLLGYLCIAVTRQVYKVCFFINLKKVDMDGFSRRIADTGKILSVEQAG